MRVQPLCVCLALLAALAAVVVPTDAGGPGDFEPYREEVTPLLAQVLAPPSPVAGSDDLIHLAYELVVTNALNVPVELTGLDVLDPRRGYRVVQRLHHGQLAQRTKGLGASEFGVRLAPGGTAVVWMDVVLDRRDAVPASLVHRFTTSYDAGRVVGLPPVTVQTGAPVTVGDEPLVVGPPLRGANWLVMNGCCMPPTNHRLAVLPVNGALHAAERYAIDFVRLDGQNRFVSGNPARLDSYDYYSADVLAVADGTVIRVLNEVEENTAVGELGYPITMGNVGGNYVIIDMGQGAYAFYAHLVPDSIRVKVGDRVRRGDVIAHLGNTGNSTMPHLHFHILDRPLALGGNGIPYVFDSYRIRGYVSPDNGPEVLEGAPVRLDPVSAELQAQRATLPLDGALIDFPE